MNDPTAIGRRAWLGALLLAGCAATSPPGGPSADGTTPNRSATRPVALPSPPPPAATAADAGAGRRCRPPAAAPTPVDPLRPEREGRPRRRRRAADLWDAHPPRLRDARPRQRPGARPRAVVRQRGPTTSQRMTERSSRYLFHIVEELERRDMPTELALLPFIESAFNPQAVSSATAAGMWQFMPATGTRLRPASRTSSATTAATCWPRPAPRSTTCRSLHGMFGDWHLALAAYNWGEGSVRPRHRAQPEAPACRPTTPDLRMPDETRLYVPKLQAVKNIVANPQTLRRRAAADREPPVLPERADRRATSTSTLAAQLADVPLDDFKALNPQMHKPVILAAGTPQILLPWDNANRLPAQLRRLHRRASTPAGPPGSRRAP